MEIIFATANKEKIKSAERDFKGKIKVIPYDIELIEPKIPDVKEVAVTKVKQAYKVIKKPCIVMDVGFEIESLNNYPGTYIKYMYQTIGLKRVVKIMKGEENKNCKYIWCTAYYDGREIKIFISQSEGTIVPNISEADLEKNKYIESIFIPNGFNKTIAKMNEEERLEYYNQRPISSLTMFANYFIDETREKQIYRGIDL